MNKKILIISTSPRKNANSFLLAAEFARGAKAAGHAVELISLAGKEIGFCKGCLACQKTGQCVIHDDVNEIVQKMLTADVLVFATPIYYYEISGQMKTMLDRSNPLFAADYSFRQVYFLAAAAEEEDHAWSRAVSGLEGWIECFDKSHLAGVVFGGGVTNPGEINENHSAMKKAYEMGKELS